MPSVAGFLPSTHAPLFQNGSANNPWPVGTEIVISIPGLPDISISATAMGFCGGMSFLTRDIFEAGTPQLRGQNTGNIPLPLAQFLLARLIDSFNIPSGVLDWIGVTRMLNHDTWFRGEGLFGYTSHRCERIMQEVDAGRLCPIGTVLVYSHLPTDVFNNHVELVYGYEFANNHLLLNVYDPNKPARDDITIEVDLNPGFGSAPARPIKTNGTHQDGAPGFIRGFFPLSYRFEDPAGAYIDDGKAIYTKLPPALMGPGSTADVEVTATNIGSSTWFPDKGYRLGSQSPQDNTVWGPGRVELTGGPVDPEGSVRFNFTITAPSENDKYTCQWQMVHEMVTWFGDPTAGWVVAVGSTSDVCQHLRDEHARLTVEYDQARAELRKAIQDHLVQLIAVLRRKVDKLAHEIAEVEHQMEQNNCGPP